MASYLTILAVALLAAFSAPWYFLLVGTAVLIGIALRKQRQYHPRFAALGISGLVETAAYTSTVYALLASFAAYALGVAARMVFLTG